MTFLGEIFERILVSEKFPKIFQKGLLVRCQEVHVQL